MINNLVIIGWLGAKEAFLNISKEEAVKRYFEMYPDEEEHRDSISETAFEFEFNDNFQVYDAWPKETSPLIRLWYNENAIKFYQGQIELSKRYIEQDEPPFGKEYWLDWLKRMEGERDLLQTKIDDQRKSY